MPAEFHQQSLPIRNAMSVDVEDYFHTEVMSRAVPRSTWDRMPCRVERNTDRLFEIFANHRARATFFFLGWVAKRFPALVRRAKQLGHEIGCHSYWHRPVYTLLPSEFREDTLRAKAIIEDAAGSRVLGYRAPSFSLTRSTEWAAEILAEAGFAYDSSVHPIAHDIYDNREAPRFPYRLGETGVLEVPVSTLSIADRNVPFAGGGYFRILPYQFIHWAIRRVNQTDRSPVVFYLHPWEIDPDQPRMPVGLRSRFRHYTGLAGTAKGLRKLLAEFSFAPVGETFIPEWRSISLQIPSAAFITKEMQNIPRESAQIGHLNP